MVTWPKKAPSNGSLLVRPDTSCVAGSPVQLEEEGLQISPVIAQGKGAPVGGLVLILK